jgi:uncharacterized membrane-anchored protein YitT (DUF2179 family)
MLTALLAYVFAGNVGSLLMLFVGILVCVAITVFIMKQMEAPPMAYKILYVAIAVIVLIIAISFFFGGGGDVGVRVHDSRY